MRTRDLYPHYDVVSGDDGEPQYEFHFDSEGLIGRIFFYNPKSDRMVKADMAWFHTQETLYREIQDRVDSIIKDQDFKDSVKYGT